MCRNFEDSLTASQQRGDDLHGTRALFESLHVHVFETCSSYNGDSTKVLTESRNAWTWQKATIRRLPQHFLCHLDFFLSTTPRKTYIFLPDILWSFWNYNKWRERDLSLHLPSRRHSSFRLTDAKLYLLEIPRMSLSIATFTQCQSNTIYHARNSWGRNHCVLEKSAFESLKLATASRGLSIHEKK